MLPYERREHFGKIEKRVLRRLKRFARDDSVLVDLSWPIGLLKEFQERKMELLNNENKYLEREEEEKWLDGWGALLGELTSEVKHMRQEEYMLGMADGSHFTRSPQRPRRLGVKEFKEYEIAIKTAYRQILGIEGLPDDLRRAATEGLCDFFKDVRELERYSPRGITNRTRILPAEHETVFHQTWPVTFGVHLHEIGYLNWRLDEISEIDE